MVNKLQSKKENLVSQATISGPNGVHNTLRGSIVQYCHSKALVFNHLYWWLDDQIVLQIPPDSYVLSYNVLV